MRRRAQLRAPSFACPADPAMNAVKAILLKVASALLFAVMSTLVRWVSADVPVGEVVFFRSAFAIVPVVLIYAWRRELTAAVRTGRPLGHVTRGLLGVVGMFLSFAALARLPLAEVTAIGFAAPLITVALAALVLHERVRIYRWSAVAVGFVGVIVMLLPHLDAGRLIAGGSAQTAGALFALTNAFTSAASTIQTRRLTGSETNSAIVFYFSVFAALGGLASLPFGWVAPSAPQLAALVVIGFLGGIAHLLMTESFRLAPASLVAPFDYTSILWAFVLGYAVFGEVPTSLVFVGAAIVTAAGLFVIWRERQLGLERARTMASGAPVKPERREGA
jgi:drug/metabolite transporter (DMT)-like permease